MSYCFRNNRKINRLKIKLDDMDRLCQELFNIIDKVSQYVNDIVRQYPYNPSNELLQYISEMLNEKKNIYNQYDEHIKSHYFR